MVDQTRAVSGFPSGKGFDGKGKAKGQGKSKDGKGKAEGKMSEKGKEQIQPDKNGQFQGYCGYCEKWRHKRADCRKRIADGKTKGGAAAASVDNDGEVQAVMEIDDEGESLGWCFGVTSLCAAVGSTGSLLLDEHLCTPKFADLIPATPDRSPLKLKDVQQNELAITGQKIVPMMVRPTFGKQSLEATATFRVAEELDNILSLGKLIRKGFNFVLGPRGCSMEKDGRAVPLYLERNSLRVEAHVLQRAMRPGCVAAWTAVADDSNGSCGRSRAACVVEQRSDA